MSDTCWPKKRLSDFIAIKHGFAFKSQFFANEGDYVVLTPGNFLPGGGFQFDEHSAKFYRVQPPSDYILVRGNLLVAMTDLTQSARILGSAAWVPVSGRFLHNQRLGKIEWKNPDIDKRFIYYVLNSAGVREQLKATATGTTVRHTAPVRIEAATFLCPGLDVQRRIGSMLSAYDDLIENNTRRIAILEEMAQRIFEEWFVHFRAPGCEGLRVIDSEIGPLPLGWRVAPMERVCSRITDGAHKSPQTSEEGIPMASVKDMAETDFNISGCRLISEADYAELKRNDCKPLRGDILIAKDGSYLKHVFLVREERDLAILSSIAILRPNGALKPNLMVQFLKHPTVSDRMKGYVSGVAIPRIVLRDFRQFPIAIPPSNIQEQFEFLVAPFMTLSWQLNQVNRNLRAQRDLLLPKLISGEIELSPASASLMEAAE